MPTGECGVAEIPYENARSRSDLMETGTASFSRRVLSYIFCRLHTVLIRQIGVYGYRHR